MTVEELAHTITQLPVADRLTLLELISRSVRETVAASSETGASRFDAATLLEAIQQRAGSAGIEHSALRELLGIAASDSEAPSDEQVRDWLADELSNRHR